ncbi:hypothetical protein [Spirosoma sp. 209]|uniref:hypothetical protein n=1 Tax=Spirosoma sp. 209 TaxID=1955701 RepID=UPI00098D4851|nr:hypothetical protein [Spirosoma sp. 209]
METLSFKNISFSAEVEDGEPIVTISLLIDGEKQGQLVIARTGTYNQYAIDGVEINPAFRGMGFYRQLLMNALNMVSGCDSLLSAERNIDSNPVYQYWTGKELAVSDKVEISIYRDTLEFDVIEG